MKNLVIVGAGGFGREICSVAKTALGYGTEFTVKGFLDRKPDALGGKAGYPPVLGAPETYAIEPEDVFFVALGNLRLRRKNADLIASRGGTFLTLIHPSASLGTNVTIGAGCYIAHNAVLTADVTVGDNVCVFHGTVIGHDCRIGSCSHVSSLVFLGGGVQVGEGVTIHPGVRVASFKRIGDGATLGIGSVVLANVRERTTAFGNPALPV